MEEIDRINIQTTSSEGQTLQTVVNNGPINLTTQVSDVPQIQTVLQDNISPIASVINNPFVEVTSVNGMTGDVITEAQILGFIANKFYKANTIISYNGNLYWAKQDFTSTDVFDVNDWNLIEATGVSDWDDIQNKPTFATVATSGSYNDLSDQPSINNGSLTIKRNNTLLGSFTANSSTNTDINITVPTRTSELTNNSDFITSSDLPTVNDATLTIQKNATNIGTFTANSATNKTVNIVVPTNTGDLINNSGFVTANDMYPINSIRILADTADHSTDFGQTWVRYGAGRVLVGYDTSQTEFKTIGKTGGEKTHKLTVNEMPSHKHSLPYRTGGGGGSTWYTDPGTAEGYSDSKSQAQGGDQAHNNLQPYIVVSFWRRTA